MSLGVCQCRGDLIDILSDNEALGDASKGTIEAAMDDIRRDIDAARKLHQRIWDLGWNQEAPDGEQSR